MQQLINPAHLISTIEHAGPWGPVAYVAAIAISVVISQIPGAPLAIAAGALWHPILAALYTVIGGFSGALIAYGLGHRMGQPLIKALTGKTLNFSTEQGETYLGWIIFTTRLLPIFSFDLISYGAGIARLSLPIYASATLFGMIPSTLLLTGLGGSLHISDVHVSSSAIALFASVCLILFVGVPALMHRYNWFNISAVVSWE